MLKFSVVAMVALAVLASAPAHAGGKKAVKLLQQIRTVDGAGSGLDADTVRGKTPDDIVASAVAQARAALTAVVQSAYQAPSQVNIAPGFCDCAYSFCTQANDLMINCGGVIEPLNAAAYLTQVSQAGVNSQTVGCVACACNSGVVSITLLAPATCVHTQ